MQKKNMQKKCKYIVCISQICTKYARNMHKYACYMQLYAKKYARYMQKNMQIYRLYWSNMQNICTKYARNMHKYANHMQLYQLICQKYAIICQKYAINMQ